MRRLGLPVLAIVVGIVLLADFIVVNPALATASGLALDLVILVATGVALAGTGALALRHGADLVQRRGSIAAPLAVLGGMAAMLIAGLRPGSDGAADPAVRWIVAALLIPLAASLFGLLFASTLSALRRAVASRRPDALVLAVSASVVVLLLLPLDGAPGEVLAAAGGWVLDVPIGAVFRGLLIGVAVVTAVAAARTLLGIGPSDD